MFFLYFHCSWTTFSIGYLLCCMPAYVSISMSTCLYVCLTVLVFVSLANITGPVAEMPMWSWSWCGCHYSQFPQFFPPAAAALVSLTNGPWFLCVFSLCFSLCFWCLLSFFVSQVFIGVGVYWLVGDQFLPLICVYSMYACTVCVFVCVYECEFVLVSDSDRVASGYVAFGASLFFLNICPPLCPPLLLELELSFRDPVSTPPHPPSHLHTRAVCAFFFVNHFLLSMATTFRFGENGCILRKKREHRLCFIWAASSAASASSVFQF